MLPSHRIRGHRGLRSSTWPWSASCIGVVVVRFQDSERKDVSTQVEAMTTIVAGITLGRIGSLVRIAGHPKRSIVMVMKKATPEYS
jgi:hypothetical protein